ncbi:Gp49 family protein [Peribacillus kribbensis]|uniref:Gp49 family protein n=1 Tax=Peribacillus kribbensis TaxID=356658 RepID=UPI0003F8AC8F|nr:Gp49 family protein [Peribacillus kribbensis]
MIHLDSICPKCGEISHVEHKGEKILLVTCNNHHVYEHIVIPHSREYEIKDEKRSLLEEMIVEKKFYRMSDKSTICLLIFNNGYEIEGRSTVRNAEDFRTVIGKDKAYEQALRKAMEALSPVLESKGN